MKRTGRTKGLLRNVILGFLCFVFLTLALSTVQLAVSVTQHYENAVQELMLVRDALNAQPSYAQVREEQNANYKDSAQKAAILLEGEELSNEKLAEAAEILGSPQVLLIADKNGRVRYRSGSEAPPRDFLLELNETRLGSVGDIVYAGIPFGEDLLAVGWTNLLREEHFEDADAEFFNLSELSSGLTGDLMVLDSESRKLVYAPRNLKYRNLDEVLLPVDDAGGHVYVLFDDYSIQVAIGLEYKQYILLNAAGLDQVFFEFNTAIVPALLGFGILISVLLAYVEFILTDMRLGRLGKIHYMQVGKKRYLNADLWRKLAGFAVVGITCMACIIYCLQLLIRSDEQSQEAENRLAISVRVMEDMRTKAQMSEEADKLWMIDVAKEIRAILEMKPSLIHQEGLTTLARFYGVDSIYVMDEAGKAIATDAAYKSYSISSDPQDASYPFWDVVNGFAESYVLQMHTDLRGHAKEMIYVGVPSQDGRGMLQVGFPYGEGSQWKEAGQSVDALKRIGVDSRSVLLAVDDSTGICTYSSSGDYLGAAVADYGISKDLLRDGYAGTHVVDGRECLLTTDKAYDWILVYITPMNWITTNSMIFTALVVAISLLAVVLALLPQLIVRTPEEDLHVPAHKNYKASRRSYIEASLSGDGQVVIVEDQREEASLEKRWHEKNAGEKLRGLVSVMTVLLAGFMLLFLTFQGGSNPLITRILERNWDQKMSVYAVAYVAIVLFGIWIAARILQKLTLYVTGTFGSRWRTSGMLLANVIRYGAFIASIFFTLQNFGVDTRTLITSASVLTLIFGLGSQSFVADLIAGVFLIFEGTFRVGDIVTIDGWRGEVVEIGLRATKVKNPLGNVKIFQNSRISGAINMTSDQTYAVCDIALPQGQPLEAFEQKLKDSFFPMAKEKVSGMRYPLTYEGVIAVSAAGATLRISVRCLEAEREQLQRELYRSLKLWQEQQ